jgi:hypothetical protein
MTRRYNTSIDLPNEGASLLSPNPDPLPPQCVSVDVNYLIDEAIRTGEIVQVTFTGWPREQWESLKPENFTSATGQLRSIGDLEWVQVHHPEQDTNLLRESIVNINLKKTSTSSQ